MLPIVLVLLVATSALAAPSVSVAQASINEVVPYYDSSYLFNTGVANQALEMCDQADANIYILTIEQIVQDMAGVNDSYVQALGLSQLVALLGELANGVAGDACAAANAIDAFVSGGTQNYLSSLAGYIDTIANLANNPASLRYSSGPRQNCVGGGRSYQFEAGWDAILSSVSPDSLPLVNEEYCAAKRLYNAFNARSNNVGAAITAAALPPVVQAVQRASPQILDVIRTAIAGGNAYAAAATAKNALYA